MIRWTDSASILCGAWLGFSVGAVPLGAQTRQPACSPGNAGLTLPPGFCALVVADSVGRARHLSVAPNGDVFVALAGANGGLLALRDTTGDGVADVRVRFGTRGGTGIALRGDYLYFAPDDGVVRYPWRAGSLEPGGPPEEIVRALPAAPGHRAKGIAFGAGGALYVSVGSPSNACQERDRMPGAAGLDPCPELETRAGVWRFDADRSGQTQADGVRFATGLRNSFALAVNPVSGALYGAVHGRDQLLQNWGGTFTAEQSAEKPSEELVRIESGDNFGWPYCYHDREQNRKVLAPEYGGDGQAVGRCAGVKAPEVALPAHWAPNALSFYAGAQFPARYRGGAFIAFHGSWNRAPLAQGGYQVVFVPFEGARSTGRWETFADGFAGPNMQPREAEHRPSGLAVGPDGSLYVADDQGGRIYRILYRGRI